MGDILLIGNGINESESLGKYLKNVSAMDDTNIQLFGKIIVKYLNYSKRPIIGHPSKISRIYAMVC